MGDFPLLQGVIMSIIVDELLVDDSTLNERIDASREPKEKKKESMVRGLDRTLRSMVNMKEKKVLLAFLCRLESFLRASWGRLHRRVFCPTRFWQRTQRPGWLP